MRLPSQATTLGADGVGKSSCLKALSGRLATGPGACIRLAGVELADLATHDIVEAGLMLVPENRGFIAGLDVRETTCSVPPRAGARGEQISPEVLSLFFRVSPRGNARSSVP